MTKHHHRRTHGKNRSAVNKHTAVVITVWVVAALSALLLALLAGNCLGNTANSIRSGIKSDNPVYTYETDDVPPVLAEYFNPTGYTDSTLTLYISGLPESISAVSVPLKTGSTVLYKSDVNYAFRSSYGGIIDLSDTVTAFHGKNIYVSVTVEVSSPSLPEGYARDALISFETALLCEIADAGVDDIVIYGLPTDNEGISAASLLFSGIRKKNADIILGAAVPSLSLTEKRASYIIETYSSFADIVAVDTTDTTKIATETVTSLLPYFRQYPLRVLSVSTDFVNQVSEFSRIGITNVQFFTDKKTTVVG